MKKIAFLLSFLFLAHPGWANNLDMFFKTDSQYQDVLVHEVLSVDRIVIYTKDREKEQVKLIGVKGPKKEPKKKTVQRDQFGFRIKDPVVPTSSVEDRAFAYVQELLDQKHVRLEFDDEKKDAEGHTLAYVFLKDKQNTLANAEILRMGYAQLQIRPPNTKYQKELLAAYKEARQQLRGFQGL